MRQVFIDIETRPNPAYVHPERLDAFVRSKVPKNYSKPESIETWVEANREDVWDRTALDTLEGQVWMIGAAVDDEPAEVFCSDVEWRVLEAFEEWLIQEVNDPRIVWIGHNIRAFDLPWLWRRAVKHHMSFLARAIPTDRWAKNVDDTMLMFAAGEFPGKYGLDAVARWLDLEGKPEGVDGSQVPRLWREGETETVREYCRADVELTRKVYRALSF